MEQWNERKRVPKMFFNSIENCRIYLDWLFNKLNYKSMEDWYELNTNDLRMNCGGALLSKYEYSPCKIVISVYSEYQWDIFKFKRNTQIAKNEKEYLDLLFIKLKLKTVDDWYSVKYTEILKNKGEKFIRGKYNSHIELITNNIENDWKEWMFVNVSRGFWDIKENRKNYLNWLFDVKKFTKMEDWYSITLKDFKENYGFSLLMKFKGCIIDTLKQSLDYEFVDWHFKIISRNYWTVPENRRNFIEWFRNKLNLNSQDQWYELTKKSFICNFGGKILEYFNNSTSRVIMECLPEYEWDIEKFYKKGNCQKFVYQIVKKKYPDAKYNYKHPDFKFKKSNKKMELDIFIPSLNLAIEYQGKQHYQPAWGGEEELINLKKRDKEKKKKCLSNGIKWIEIYYNENVNDKLVYCKIDEVLRGEVVNNSRT